MINPENKNDKSQPKPKIKCATIPAPKNVIAEPKVISFVITGPTFIISFLFLLINCGAKIS